MYISFALGLIANAKQSKRLENMYIQVFHESKTNPLKHSEHLSFYKSKVSDLQLHG